MYPYPYHATHLGRRGRIGGRSECGHHLHCILALLLLQLRGTVGHLCTTLLVQASIRRQLFFHGHDPHGHSPHGHSPSGAGQCSNTCTNYASDGDCDDGSPGSEYSHCTLGTDCYDCGPRLPSHSHFPHGHSPPSPPLAPPPPPPPPPPPLNTYFTVVSGSCTVDPSSPNCILSPRISSNYGSYQSCSITPTAFAIGKPLTATYPYGYLDGLLRIPSYPSGSLTSFSGFTGPSNFVVGPGTIQWAGTQGEDWRLCSYPSPPPPADGAAGGSPVTFPVTDPYSARALSASPRGAHLTPRYLFAVVEYHLPQSTVHIVPSTLYIPCQLRGRTLVPFCNGFSG